MNLADFIKVALNLMVFHSNVFLLLITQNTKIKLFLVNRIILYENQQRNA
jgi:hypothetical protein